MSTADVEQPSSATQSPRQHLPIDDIELIDFRARLASRHISPPSVIVVDDDALEGERNFASLLQRSASMSSTPPATGQGVDDDNSVIVVEDTGFGRARGNRRADNGAQTRPIVVLDSDDEQGQPSGSAPARRRVRRTRTSSSFRIFSPPPPTPHHHPVPPVPALPPIIAQPLPFSILPPPQRRNQGRPTLPFDEPAQAINNHNHGNGSGIHLGGGLLSHGNSSRRRTGPRAQVHYHSPHSARHDELFDDRIDNNTPLDRASSLFTNFFASYFGTPPFMSSESGSNPLRGQSNVSPGRVRRHLPEGLNFQAFGVNPRYPPSQSLFGLAAFGSLGPWGRRDATLGLGPDYDKSMTHPERPGPGWTYDFGTEHEEGASKVEGSEILVCAQCLDPLLANADGMVSVSEKEKKDRRVWGLRCGHVLDGKCVDLLMLPELDRELAGEENVEDINPEGVSMAKRRRKGAGERVEPGSASENEVKGLVTTPDVKGKGKARAAPVNNAAPQPFDDGEKLPPPSTECANNPPPPDTSMRSRLRPRRNGVVSPSSATTGITSVPFRNNRSPIRIVLARGSSSTQHRGSKRKRANSPVAEVVEARHEWTCPVSGCGRVHISIKLRGQWKMDPDSGAIAIYV